MFSTSLNVSFKKKTLTDCHQISPADSVILYSKNNNIKQHFFPFMFETTTFMTSDENQTCKNGGIQQKGNTRIDTSFGLLK